MLADAPLAVALASSGQQESVPCPWQAIGLMLLEQAEVIWLLSTECLLGSITTWADAWPSVGDPHRWLVNDDLQPVCLSAIRCEHISVTGDERCTIMRYQSTCTRIL